MKLPSRHIIILLIVSLTALFGYQVYWLSGLYKSRYQSDESLINVSLQMADFAEIMERVKTLRSEGDLHGSVTIAQGWSNAGKQTKVRTDSVVVNNDGTRTIKVTTIKTEKSEDSISASASSYAVSSPGEMSSAYQIGLHQGIDNISKPNPAVLDSILMERLASYEVNAPHRLLMLSGADTLAVVSTQEYTPSSRAKDFDLSYGEEGEGKIYRLTMEPLTLVILRKMAGVIAASLVLFLILAFSFWFLIHTMLKQKSLEEMKSDFTNNITHELKTPGAVAYAANDALLNFEAGNDPEKRREYLEISQAQLEKLEGMIEQILSMSMESRKTFELRRETIELEPLLQKLSEQHRLSAGKPCDIHIDVEDDLVLDADSFHLSNILSNLIDNAIKYSRESVRIDITAKATDEGVEIRVRDNGIGIAPDKQKHIFEKFYRVPTGNIHDVKGYGLGLYYARTMAEKHGGTLSLTSAPGKGSEFVLSL
ncbi:MAG: HAMP domain-containing sensor histidine kinase [Bacteroidales bacterium]|nr:HAMP domain-containing sensor histidine kinase [Bacteroidales bacterium]